MKTAQLHVSVQSALLRSDRKETMANIEHFRYHKLKRNTDSYVFAPRER